MPSSGGIYRALVVSSNDVTGEILVSAPALSGSDTVLPISFANRSHNDGLWNVPAVGDLVVIAVDDDNASNLFLVPSLTDTGYQDYDTPAGGNPGDLLVKLSGEDFDTGWTDSPTVDSLYYDTAVGESLTTVGQTTWNDTYGSLSTLLKGGNVPSVVGQTLHQRVVNTTGGTLSKGQVVYLTGASGQKVTVGLAQANMESTSSKSFGIVAETIEHNQQGFVITEGLLGGFNTGALTEGALVWLSPTTAGQMTTTKPSAPNHTVMLGVCVKSGNGTSGSVFVKIQNGLELEELHNVSIPAGLPSNSLIVYNNTTGLWHGASSFGYSGASVPAGPVAGQTWYDTTTQRQLTYTGTAWKIISGNWPRITLRYTSTFTVNGTRSHPWNVEEEKVDITHSNSVNNFRITIPTGMGGIYYFSYSVIPDNDFDGTTSSNNNRIVWVDIETSPSTSGGDTSLPTTNGPVSGLKGRYGQSTIQNYSGSNANRALTGSGHLVLSAGDTVRVKCSEPSDTDRTWGLVNRSEIEIFSMIMVQHNP